MANVNETNRTSGLESGVQIGDFRIEERIGAGGMGIVYRARQMALNRPVALKVLGGALSRDNDIVRFRREAQAAARLKHPNIASVYFIGQDDQVCYIAMELVDGVSLSRVIEQLAHTSDGAAGLDSIVADERKRTGAAEPVRFDTPTEELSSASPSTAGDSENPYRSPESRNVCGSMKYVKRCCEVVRSAAQALAHAHENSVVHRDIKPDNLLLAGDGQPHIIDFGIARFFDDASVTFTGQLVGTPMYMSPEQIAGRIDVDHRTDIYSLGMVLYELLTLAPPVQASTRERLLRQIVTKPLAPVSWLNPSAPRDLESIVHKATHKDPDERYQSALELADDLQKFLDKKPVAAPAYRYQFDMREIVASRPGDVVVSSVLFFLAAAFCAFMGAMMASMFFFATQSFMFTMLPMAVVPLAMTAGCIIVGVNLLAGRNWSRWLAALVTLLIMAGSIMMIVSLSFTMTMGAFGGGDLPEGIDREQVRMSMLGSMTPMVGLFIFSTLSGVAVLFMLFRRRTRQWFRMAGQLRAEHRRLRQQLRRV